MEELKPCPFCGEKAAELSSGRFDGKDTSYVTCAKCGSCGEFFFVNPKYASAERAIDAWNRRATIEPEPWIPVSERLPEKPNVYTVTDTKGDVARFVFDDTESSREYWLRCAKAWMPSPEPYKENSDG